MNTSTISLPCRPILIFVHLRTQRLRKLQPVRLHLFPLSPSTEMLTPCWVRIDVSRSLLLRRASLLPTSRNTAALTDGSGELGTVAKCKRLFLSCDRPIQTLITLYSGSDARPRPPRFLPAVENPSARRLILGTEAHPAALPTPPAEGRPLIRLVFVSDLL